MKKNIYLVLFSFSLAFNDNEFQKNQNNIIMQDYKESKIEIESLGENFKTSEIQQLEEEIRSYGYDPQNKILKKKNTLKQKDFYSKNGFFMGILFGSGLIYNSYEDGKYNRKNNVEGAVDTGVLLQKFSNNAMEFFFGGKIGYQNFFSENFGTRIYGDALLGSGTIKYNGMSIGTNTYMLGALNVDFLMEYALGRSYDIGIFAGFGFGAMLMSEEGKNTDDLLLDKNFSSENILWKNFLQIDYTFNVGCNFSYLKKHRFELGFKIPVSFLRLGLEKPATYTSSSDTKTLMSQDIDFNRSSFFTLSYIYIF